MSFVLFCALNLNKGIIIILLIDLKVNSTDILYMSQSRYIVESKLMQVQFYLNIILQISLLGVSFFQFSYKLVGGAKTLFLPYAHIRNARIPSLPGGGDRR